MKNKITSIFELAQNEITAISGGNIAIIATAAGAGALVGGTFAGLPGAAFGAAVGAGTAILYYNYQNDPNNAICVVVAGTVGMTASAALIPVVGPVIGGGTGGAIIGFATYGYCINSLKNN